MSLILNIINDFIIILLNCLLYINLTPLKKDNLTSKIIIIISCIVMTTAYFLCAYKLQLSYGLSTVICLTIPSFILFFILCKYKNAKFIATFCLLDTFSFILAVFTKIIMVIGGVIGEVLSTIILIILVLFVLFKGLSYFKMYRHLMDIVKDGWTPVAISGFFDFTLLVVALLYPKPLIEREEYTFVYILLCLTILTFYSVFILFIKDKAKLIYVNGLLKKQQYWQQLAYLDELTKLGNKAAYNARVKELKKKRPEDKSYYLLMIDIDSFKQINDTYGHLVGNSALQNTARYFLKTFMGDNYEFYRIGGDEFVAIVHNITEAEVKEIVYKINNKKSESNSDCKLSCGSCRVDFTEEKCFEKAFLIADKLMYESKSKKKKVR